MGTTALRTVQFGRESTWGTGVAAAAIMSGVNDLKFNPGITVTQKRYLSGSLQPAQTSSVTRKSPTFTLDGDVTPEDIIYLLDSSVKGTVTPTGANPYVYTFTFPTTADPAVRSRTVELYDGSQCWELNGGIVNKITFKGSSGDDNVTYTAEWIGKQLIPTTITGALSTRAFTVFPAQSCSLYLDAAGATIGTTVVSTTLIDWEYTVDMGHHTKFFMDGGTVATAKGIGVPSVMLKCTFEYNASAHTELTNHIAGTARLARITATGSGTNVMNFDIAAVATSMDDLYQDRDGNTTCALTYTAQGDTGAFANYAKIIVTNTVSAFITNA